MSGQRSPGPVPKRWLHCPRKASSLIIGKFMALKAPLCDKFNSVVPQDCRFPPRMLFDLCKTKKIKFGLWIDLTNTDRFYSREEVEAEGCTYVKLKCAGHEETPTRDQTKTFIQLVHRFIIHHPLECIAVHCTHGFNRTGFLIVSYLVEKGDCSLEIAIEMFANARPPGIYKADYLKELYARYDDVDDTPPPPALPDWCFEEDSDLDGASTSTSSPERNRQNKNAKFMDGVKDVELVTQQTKTHELQRKVQRMCHWSSKKGFPGCQPVSMDIANIKLLHQEPYRVSWKADGTRYMMLIDGINEVYFFDRDFNVFKVNNLTFPHCKDLRKHLQETLLDGEMVIDKVDDQKIPRYLVYDIVKINGLDVDKHPFYPTRLHCIESEIIKPRYIAMENGIINKSREPFSVRKKDFWEIQQAGNLLGEKFAKTLSHEPDGLIFQPSKEPYIAGRCDIVLKWKPLDMNSVDFRLKIVREEGQGIVSQKICYLYVGQLDTPFAKMKYKKSLKDLDNKIVECKFEDNQWKFMRERTDKSFPNGYDTAFAVWGSIKQPITKEYLLEYIEKYRFKENDSVIMPPPSKKIRR